jgi:hypothetical protein
MTAFEKLVAVRADFNPAVLFRDARTGIALGGLHAISGSQNAC